MTKKIGLIGIRGLPAQYGAFDQHCLNLIDYSENLDIKFYVSCEHKFKKINFNKKNVVRIYSYRSDNFGHVIYNLLSFFKMYLLGVRTFFFFGYGLSFFFNIIIVIFRCKVICNVDGIEWRRKNIGIFKKFFFRLCEYLAAKSKAILIYDSIVIKRYYRKFYKKNGELIYYTSDIDEIVKKNNIVTNSKQKYFFLVQRLLQENSIDIIIDAFIETDNDNYKLVITGPNNNYFNTLLEKIKKNKSKIIYTGPIYDRIKLAQMWNNASFYLHGHQVGGTNPTLIEACMLNKKIIAHNNMFNKSILKKNALYFKNKIELLKIFNNIDNYQINSQNISFDNFLKKYVCEKYINLT
jgi:hypothetical protein